ncbi:hypothetical protein FHL15_003180 [Xylaria flabelliformis]|uniref:Uncharacterized protein n=1 Tax=Xylaria flabelliformis TaxID=2512241 RepID=A0A553I761_9PEZI|nr:hypothetical protein FHL15_003180 [Xylaria flabelliformis]
MTGPSGSRLAIAGFARKIPSLSLSLAVPYEVDEAIRIVSLRLLKLGVLIIISITSSVEITVPGRESAETDLVDYMDFPPTSRPESALNHNQESSSSRKQFKCLDPKYAIA